MSTAATNEQIVQEAIGEISHIATLPEITMKIVELVEDPKSTAQDLHNLISNDPALCSRVLKVVNSSFYGLPGQIASINRAIVMLGLNAVKNIAIAASLAKLFRGGQLTPDFSARNLWEHSIATATTAKLIADKLGFGLSDEAFLAGLMHDIGVMVEMQFDRNKLIDVLDRARPGPDGAPTGDMIEAEQEIFGADHQQFGAGLCAKWKFPSTLVSVTKFHHDPLSAPSEHKAIVCITYVAERLVAEMPEGFRLDLASTDIDDDVLDAINLSREKLQKIQDGLEEHLQNSKDLLT